MWRKLATLGLAALMALCTLDYGHATEKRRQDQHGGGQDRDRRDRVTEAEVVRSIRLRNEATDRQVLIEAVVLSTDHGLFGLRTSAGIERDSLDKVQLGNVPLIGSLFNSKMPEGLGPDQEVGRAYSVGTVLVVTLWPRVEGADIRLEILPRDIDAVDQVLRGMEGLNPALPDAITTPTVGTGPIESLVLANETSLYEVRRSQFQDLGLDDSHTVVLGGLEDRIGREESGVPLLGDLPVLGYLFQGKTYRRESELVVIIKPTIVETME